MRDFDVDRNAAALSDRIRRSLAGPDRGAAPAVTVDAPTDSALASDPAA
jgi:hypothetical protein